MTYPTCQEALQDKHTHRDCTHHGQTGRQGDVDCSCWCHVRSTGPAVTAEQVIRILGEPCKSCGWTRGHRPPSTLLTACPAWQPRPVRDGVCPKCRWTLPQHAEDCEDYR